MNAMSMADVIVPKSDQWNADDFVAGPITFTIREVQIRGGQEQPVNILLDGSDKAYRPCKSMSRVLVHAWGPDAKVYIGRSLTLYTDPSVKWGGLEVGGIRISHMSHIDGKLQMALTATKGQRKPFVVMPLVAEVKPINSDARAKAEEWTAEHIGAVEIAGDLASLEKLIATGNAHVAKLKAGHKDLCERVMDAYNARGRELEAATSGASDDAADDDFATGDA